MGGWNKGLTGKDSPTYKHGLRYTRIWAIWRGMKARCCNPNTINYGHYGGRGIKLCDKWMDFMGFHEDMHAGYNDSLSIERKDVNGDYSKENCLWIPMREQSLNRRTALFVEYEGQIMRLLEYVERSHVSYSTAYHQIVSGKLKRVKGNDDEKRQRKNSNTR